MELTRASFGARLDSKTLSAGVLFGVLSTLAATAALRADSEDPNAPYLLEVRFGETLYDRPSSMSPKVGRTGPGYYVIVGAAENEGRFFWRISDDGVLGFVPEGDYVEPRTVFHGTLNYAKKLSLFTDLRKRDRVPPVAEVGDPSFRITGVGAGEPNQVGGINVGVGLEYLDERPLKYLYLDLTPHNAVGDAIRGEVRRESTRRVEITGPVERGKGERWIPWENLWYYNAGITCISVERIEARYLNDESYVWIKELPLVLGATFSNDCSYEGQQKPPEPAVNADELRRREVEAREILRLRFTVDGGVISDRSTGFQWSKSGGASGPRDASSYCRELDAGGFDDWRQPTGSEVGGMIYQGKTERVEDLLTRYQLTESRDTVLHLYDVFETESSEIWIIGGSQLSLITREEERPKGDWEKADAICVRKP